jgi:hypothetical protein
VAWEPGEYLLEASVTYGSGSEARVDRHEAELVIAPDTAMTLTSTTGLCQGPPPAQVGQDQALGVRTFVCGEARYELRPAGRTVRGELTASVMETVRETVCVRYTVTPTGDRVCAQTVERTTQRPAMRRARLNVIETR